MGLMDELKRLAHPYEGDEEFDEEVDEETAGEPKERSRKAARDEYSYDDQATPFSSSRSDNVVNINATTQLQVVVVTPTKFDQASGIADHLKDRRTVVLNLEGANKDISRRMVDFLSGVAYALEGKIKKVAVSTYIITPYNVDIIGDLIDELENSGMRF
ncbi:MAG: cell division protein SepF [Oscillospiraceae bacterium]|nr:cell division protein SepF [Oscillospiraceae bacterium]